MVLNTSSGFEPVLAALTTIQSNVDRAQKAQAHEYLEKFQKSPEAWTTTHTILSASETSVESKLFAATTLKGKIVFDLDQLPRQSLTSLRESLLKLLFAFQNGPRPIRTQLCVAMANLAIQMTEWKDVISTVGSHMGNSGLDCTLEFLRVLPEEVIEGRKINLSEDELIERTKELLEDNSQNVLQLLAQYSQSSETASSNPRLLECIASWLREIPATNVVNSPLLAGIFQSLSVEASFDSAVECICTLLRDTQEVDESLDIIQVLYPQILALRPKIVASAASDDQDIFRGYTRIFAEAGERWIVLIARLPDQFKGLVDSILECCAADTDREAISLTFLFWYEFKQMITLEKYIIAKNAFEPTFSSLVDIMIKHLCFPTSDGDDEADLFDGDREQEEKFREFRHQMGDVLKDCCEVLGITKCLGKALAMLQSWVTTYGLQANGSKVLHWQDLEAPLFAMRAMGGMVSPDEDTILKQAIPLIVQVPNHEKLQFQAIMAIGRYTEWTARHPELLQTQLNFVMAGFKHHSKEVVKAAALAFRFFGSDCRMQLAQHVVQLHGFYDSVLDTLPTVSQEELTDGVAYIVSALHPDETYETFKLYCDPIIKRLMTSANVAKESNDEASRLIVADRLQLITLFIDHVKPQVDPRAENPAVKYCGEILPVMSAIAENFTTCVPILERLCRCWRYMVLSYRAAISPLLPVLAQQLVTGFAKTRQGCYLWATDSILREFAVGTEHVDATTSQHVYAFFEQQSIAFLRIMNDVPPNELPDVIEDFFRLLIDALMFYHSNLLQAGICTSVVSAAISALALEQIAPVTATLHFLRDFLSYGTDRPSSTTPFSLHSSNTVDATGTSSLQPNSDAPTDTAAHQSQAAVRTIILSQGEALTQRIMTGLLFSFPRDCLPDASGVLLGLFEIIPSETALWIGQTIGLLPAGSIKQGETERLMAGIEDRLRSGDVRKVRVLLQDFTNAYRRRNVAPRDGLGRLEASRFRYTE